MSAFGKSGFQLGREHIREINADRDRVNFLFNLQRHAESAGIVLSDLEEQFVVRITSEHNQTVPNIHSGDRNICDSLRRKYEGRLS